MLLSSNCGAPGGVLRNRMHLLMEKLAIPYLLSARIVSCFTRINDVAVGITDSKVDEVFGPFDATVTDFPFTQLIAIFIAQQ